MATLVYKGKAIENSATAVLGRIEDIYGNPISASGINALTLRVFYHTASSTVAKGTLVVPEGEDAETYDGTALVVPSCVLDTPALDIRWPTGIEEDIEGTGYNLVVHLNGSYFPEGNVTFRVEIYVEPAEDEYVAISGDPYYLIWEIPTENVYSE